MPVEDIHLGVAQGVDHLDDSNTEDDMKMLVEPPTFLRVGTETKFLAVSRLMPRWGNCGQSWTVTSSDTMYRPPTCSITVQYNTVQYSTVQYSTA